MSEHIKVKTVGYAAPWEEGAHVFAVDIPRENTGRVIVSEVYSLATGAMHLSGGVSRAAIDRNTWGMIAESVGDYYNERLRARKIRAGKWRKGANYLDRQLGKELCVLAWAVEECPCYMVGKAVANWRGLMPEERWWLYWQAAAQGGDAIDARATAWRAALRVALTENSVKE